MIRLLDRSELPLCVGGGELFFTECQLPMQFKPEVFLERIGSLMDTGVAGVIGSFDQDGTIHGALAFSIYDDVYTGAKTATEMWWFVLPEHRGGTVAMRLIRKFESIAKLNGCERVCMIHLASLHNDRLSELYNAMGYQLIEHCYSKPIGC
jgi:GNAT superfamily N-acetyltransferase